MKQSSHETRVERLLGASLASDAVRRCPQSPEWRRGISDFEDVRPQADELTEHITARGITPLPF